MLTSDEINRCVRAALWPGEPLDKWGLDDTPEVRAMIESIRADIAKGPEHSIVDIPGELPDVGDTDATGLYSQSVADLVASLDAEAAKEDISKGSPDPVVE